MIDVAAFIILLVAAVRINRAVSAEAPIFEEFRQPRTIQGIALLYPLAPLALLFGIPLLGAPLALVVSAMCLVPGLVASRRRISAFERSGTDRTKGALGASTQAFGTALAGLLYLSVVAVFVVIGFLRE